MRFDRAFLQIFVIWGCFEGPCLRPFGTIRCNKMSSEKQMQKVLKKGFAGHTGKTVPGAVGPLNKQENRTITLLSSGTWDQARPGVPSGTVADIRVEHGGREQ